MEALADAIRLRRLHFSFGVINIVDCQKQLIVMSICSSAVFGASISQHPKHRQVMRFKEWQHAIIEKVCCCDRRLRFVEFAVSDFAVGINKRLLINSTNPLQSTNVEGILRA